MSHKATNWALEQRGLKPVAKIILFYLADCHNPIHGCFPSQEWLVEHVEICRSSLNTHLAALEQSGHIERQPGTLGTATRYILGFEMPCPKSGHERVSNLDTGRVQNLDTNPVRDLNPVNEPCKKIPAHSEPDLFQGKDPQKEESQKAEKEDPSAPIDLAFERFWKAYPDGARKTDKPACRTIFKAICTGKQKGIAKTDPETVISGALGYAKSEPGEYLKMPAGWLRGERWTQHAVQAPSAGEEWRPEPVLLELALKGIAAKRNPRMVGPASNRRAAPLEREEMEGLEIARRLAEEYRAHGVVPPWAGGTGAQATRQASA
jgi:hypothetical protein